MFTLEMFDGSKWIKDKISFPSVSQALYYAGNVGGYRTSKGLRIVEGFPNTSTEDGAKPAQAKPGPKPAAASKPVVKPVVASAPTKPETNDIKQAVSTQPARKEEKPAVKSEYFFNTATGATFTASDKEIK